MADCPENVTNGRTTETVQTSCRIIECLHELQGASVAELSNELNVSDAIVYSHLTTLEENEFIVKTGDQYRVGLRFLEFGQSARRDREIFQVVKEEAETLAEETGDVVHVMVEEHGWGVFLYKAQGKSAIKTSTYAGLRQYLHCTGNGKAILSELPEERVEEIIDKRGLPKQTESTITDRELLFDELAKIREQGVSFDDEEYMDGLRCVAVPITSKTQGLLGSISVVGPTSRLKGQRLREELSEKVKNTANIIQINASHL